MAEDFHASQPLAAGAEGAGLRAQGPTHPAADHASLPVIAVVPQMKDKAAAIHYLDRWWAELPDARGAAYFDLIQRKDSAGIDWRVRRYDQATRQVMLDVCFSGELPWVGFEGYSREWYAGGQLREELTYHKGYVEGLLRTYYPNGKPRRVAEYHRRRLVRSVCYGAQGEAISCPPYHTYAQFRRPGRSNTADVFTWINEQYPQYMPANYAGRTQDTTYYAFYVDSLGYAQKPRILLGRNEHVNAAVLKAIGSLPRFEPATQEGEPTHEALAGGLIYEHRSR